MEKEITRREKTTIYLMTAGCFLGSINQTILGPAIPSMMSDLQINASAAQWLTTIFLLVNGIMIPCTPYLMARFRAKQLYIGAMSIFCLGTFCAGIGHSFVLLLVARILQALSFGVLMPLLSGSVLMMYPQTMRGKAMGTIGVVFSIAPAIGPSIAGFIIDLYNWNVVFLGLVPFIVVNILICMFVMPDIDETHSVELDRMSVVLSTIGFGSLLYGFSAVGSFGWQSMQVYGPLLIGGVVIYAFIKRQRRLSTPLLRFETMTNKKFVIGMILCMLINAALLFGSVLTPIYLQEIRGYSVFMSAMVMFPAAVLSALINPVVGMIFDKKGGRPVILWGLLLLLIGSASYLTFYEHTATWYILLMYSVRLFGINIVQMPVTTWSMSDFEGDIIPHANALFNTLRQIAGSVGTAVFVSVYTVVEQAANSLMGIHVAFGVSSLLMVAALIFAWVKVQKEGQGNA